MRATWVHWRAGREDVVPLVVLAIPMLLWTLLSGIHGVPELLGVAVAVGAGFVLKHLLPESLENVALVPPIVVLLVEASVLSLTVEGLLLAAAAGVGLLVWAGAEPGSGTTVRQLFEPALVPALGVGVAVAVMLFLPSGTGGQVGLAALALVGVLALSAWLYLRSAVEAGSSQPTP